MKRYLITLISAFIFWIIVNMLFFIKVSHYVINSNNTIYMYLYIVFISFVSGFFIGWFSKRKGGLLGFIFGIIVIILPIVNVFTSDLFKNEAINMDSFRLIKMFFSSTNIITILCLIVSGYLGNKTHDVWSRNLHPRPEY